MLRHFILVVRFMYEKDMVERYSTLSWSSNEYTCNERVKERSILTINGKINNLTIISKEEVSAQEMKKFNNYPQN